MELQKDEILLNEIKKIISKITRIDIKKITNNASLRNDLFIDSLQASQIVFLIEEQYKIKIDEVEIFNVENVLDVVEVLKEYLLEK